MDYNLELTKLNKRRNDILKKAEKEGYKLINNELIKDDFIPVVEIYARAETQYESYGSFYVFKKTVPLSKEQLLKIKDLEFTKENIIDNFIYSDDLLSGIKELHNFYEILDVGGHIYDKNIRVLVEKDELDEVYSCLEEDQNLYLEFYFNNDNMDGYISVYDLPIKELEKQENIDIYFNKYLTFN